MDGANFYSRFKDCGVDTNRYSLTKIAKKVAGPREVREVRYYTGKITSGGSLQATHDSYMAQLRKEKVEVCLGRVEQRSETNPLASEILSYLANGPRLDAEVYKALHGLASTHRQTSYWVQKAVDTHIVADMARLAIQDAYDVAYLFSADGDLTPGVSIATAAGKKVFGVGPVGCPNFQIRSVCTTFIDINADWFSDCLPDTAYSRMR